MRRRVRWHVLAEKRNDRIDTRILAKAISRQWRDIIVRSCLDIITVGNCDTVSNSGVVNVRNVSLRKNRFRLANIDNELPLWRWHQLKKRKKSKLLTAKIVNNSIHVPRTFVNSSERRATSSWSFPRSWRE